MATSSLRRACSLISRPVPTRRHFSSSRPSRASPPTAGPSSPPPAPSSPASSPTSYCLNLTKATDHAAFLTSYFYPSLAKPAFYALHAFHAEIAQVRRKVSKEILGEMRYTWWRDAVKAVFAGDPPHHPVCLALADAHRLHHLQPYHLNRIIAAYANPLPPMPTVQELTTFAQSTRSSLLYLSLSILPPLPPSDRVLEEDRLAHAASHVGQAVGLANVLRSAGVGEGPMGRTWQGGEERWKERVAEVVGAVKEEVGRARTSLGGKGEVQREKMPVFLSAIPALVYVERLEKAGMDPRLAAAQADDWRTSWRIWRGSRKGTF